LALGDSIHHVWDYLTVHDSDLNPQPRVGGSGEVYDVHTEHIILLRPDAKWHLATGGTNGAGAMTAEDIVVNVDRARDPNTQFGQMAPMAREYDEVLATDDLTVTLRSSVPRLAAFDFFEQFRIGEPTDIDNPETAYGTGAFQLGEWRPGEQFNMLRFPDHFNPDWAWGDETTGGVSLEPQTPIGQFEPGAVRASPRDRRRVR